MMKKHILNKIAIYKINLKKISKLLILALNIYIQFISISFAQSVVSFFEPTLNVAERLSFSELSGSGGKLDAPMNDTYTAFGLNQADSTTMEGYIKEYYGVILKRLKDIGVDLDIEEKKKFPI